VVGADADAGGGGADDCGDTADAEAWVVGGILEADEDADAGISSKGCKVVGGVEISGAAGGGGGGGGSENALGGAKEPAAGIDRSGCISYDIGNGVDAGGGVSKRYSGSPA